MARTRPTLTLADLRPDQEADVFALLSAKEQLTTRDGKPYFRVSFRDATREISFPIWQDAACASACRDEWTIGTTYKLRAIYRETRHGPQLEISKIRPTTDDDRADGFDPLMCRPQSRFDRTGMWNELLALARDEIADPGVQQLTIGVLEAHREALLVLPAATRNHHAYVGGWLEHVLSVTRTCVYLADKYAEYYPDLQPPLDRDVVVAGGILHDIGKLIEYDDSPLGAAYSSSGRLIGHIVQGRDIVREYAASRRENLPAIDPDRLLRLEHVILSHQRLPEWGSPKPPMTPEALLVHYSDDIDAKFAIMFTILRDDATAGPFTSNKNLLGQHVYRGPGSS